MSSVLSPLRIPKAWTLKEVANLLGFSVRMVRWRIKRGELTVQERVWFTHPPGAPCAYKRVKHYITSDELRRWMKALERPVASAQLGHSPKQPPSLYTPRRRPQKRRTPQASSPATDQGDGRGRGQSLDASEA